MSFMQMHDAQAVFPTLHFVRLLETGGAASMFWLGLDEPFPAGRVCDRREATPR